MSGVLQRLKRPGCLTAKIVPPWHLHSRPVNNNTDWLDSRPAIFNVSPSNLQAGPSRSLALPQTPQTPPPVSALPPPIPSTSHTPSVAAVPVVSPVAIQEGSCSPRQCLSLPSGPLLPLAKSSLPSSAPPWLQSQLQQAESEAAQLSDELQRARLSKVRRSNEAHQAISIRESQLTKELEKVKFELAAEKSIRNSLELELPKLRDLCRRAKQRIVELVQEREERESDLTLAKEETAHLRDILDQESLLVSQLKDQCKALQEEVERQCLRQRLMITRNENIKVLKIVADLFQASCQRLVESENTNLESPGLELGLFSPSSGLLGINSGVCSPESEHSPGSGVVVGASSRRSSSSSSSSEEGEEVPVESTFNSETPFLAEEKTPLMSESSSLTSSEAPCEEGSPSDPPPRKRSRLDDGTAEAASRLASSVRHLVDQTISLLPKSTIALSELSFLNAADRKLTSSSSRISQDDVSTAASISTPTGVSYIEYLDPDDQPTHPSIVNGNATSGTTISTTGVGSSGTVASGVVTGSDEVAGSRQGCKGTTVRRKKGRPKNLKGVRAKLYEGPVASAEEIYPVPKDNCRIMAIQAQRKIKDANSGIKFRVQNELKK